MINFLSILNRGDLMLKHNTLNANKRGSNNMTWVSNLAHGTLASKAFRTNGGLPITKNRLGDSLKAEKNTTIFFLIRNLTEALSNNLFILFSFSFFSS
jgi:hypothetical protein